MYERGMLLGTSQIRTMQCDTLQNINTGYNFFVTWMNNLIDEHGEGFRPKSNGKKRFIAWQTYDILRVCYYGFVGLCEEFLTNHPEGYYIAPLKLNGSAVESLFSQIKFNANGKLSSLNYATAKASVMLKKDIHGNHRSGHGYRDAPLYTQTLQLRKSCTKRPLFHN